MSYKVSAIITPFCRNLLAPASVVAYFFITDDGSYRKLGFKGGFGNGTKAFVPLDHRTGLSV